MKKLFLLLTLFFTTFLLIGCSGNDSVLVKNTTKKAVWDEITKSCGMEGFPITYSSFDDGEMSISAGIGQTTYVQGYSSLNSALAFSEPKIYQAQVYVRQKNSDVVIKAIIKDDHYSWQPVDRFIDRLAEKYEVVRGYYEN